MQLQDITKEAVTIDEQATFKEALTLMVARQTNTLLVTNAQGILSGVVSVSDLLDAIVPEYLDGDDIAAHFATPEMFDKAVEQAVDKPVSAFMATDTQPVQLDDQLMAVAATAIAQRTARIPVVDAQNRPAGIISRRGLKHIIASHLGITDSV